MKKKPIKNRKNELRQKRLYFISIIISCFSVVTSSFLSYWLFLRPHAIISPLAMVFAASQTSSTNQQVDMLGNIQKQLADAKIVYSKINQIDATTYTITINDDETVFIDGSKDINRQIDSLQLITSRLTMEGKHFSRLDVRFDKPVIVF